jgi:hypothetical protein
VISRFGHILLVMTMVFATSSACFCWVQMTTDMGCHSSEEMEDCCCTQEADVADKAPVRNVPILPSVSYVLDLDEVVSVVDDLAFLPQVKLLSLAGHTVNTQLRSPPNLYLLHATFLI